jgi:hypothetical protein
MVRLEGLGKLKKFYDLIGTPTHDLLAFSITSQPCYHMPPKQGIPIHNFLHDNMCLYLFEL